MPILPVAVYHGSTGRVLMSPDGTAAASEAARLTDWSLDMQTDTVEITSLGDTNKTFIQGLPNLSGSISGFWDSGIDLLFKARKSKTGYKMYIYPSWDVQAKYFYGEAWLSLSLTGSVGDAVKISGNFSAKSAWGDTLAP